MVIVLSFTLCDPRDAKLHSSCRKGSMVRSSSHREPQEYRRNISWGIDGQW